MVSNAGGWSMNTFLILFPDIINVFGHRLSTAEIESALILYDRVAEADVIGANDELTGQAAHVFVQLFDSNSSP